MTYSSFGISDNEFIRGKAPMTKEEVRVISLSKLKLKNDSMLLDIGSGTGSVSIEMSMFSRNGHVYSLEKKEEAYNILLENIKKFNVKNISPIKGSAPEDIPKKTYDGIFIGGSGGNIEDIIDISIELLANDGRLVMNFITIENTYRAIDALKKKEGISYEITSVNISKDRKIAGLTLMEAHNPVYIISAFKEHLEVEYV